MPENAKYVGRPTKWGNPLKIIGDFIYIDVSYRRKILDPWVILTFGGLDNLIDTYKLLWSDEPHPDPDMRYWQQKFKEFDLSELEGKDLACFCHPDKPCHADVLIQQFKKEY